MVGIIGDMKSVSYGLEANRFAGNLCWTHKPDEKYGDGDEYQVTSGQSIRKRVQLNRSFRPIERMTGADARLAVERGGERDGEIEEAGKLSGPRVKSQSCERTREHIAPGITWRRLSRFAANGGRWASKPEPKALTPTPRDRQIPRQALRPAVSSSLRPLAHCRQSE